MTTFLNDNRDLFNLKESNQLLAQIRLSNFADGVEGSLRGRAG